MIEVRRESSQFLCKVEYLKTLELTRMLQSFISHFIQYVHLWSFASNKESVKNSDFLVTKNFHLILVTYEKYIIRMEREQAITSRAHSDLMNLLLLLLCSLQANIGSFHLVNVFDDIYVEAFEQFIVIWYYVIGIEDLFTTKQ